ncbi:MAG TPA: TetR/AcrR family transcriptional regulator [Alphaproteobacteria bacterium]|nr:TetR/AcrR family transcriptional regulator [Alphaproteobacteria bacterium]
MAKSRPDTPHRAKRRRNLPPPSERLMEVALELFSKGDYGSISIKQIAKAAEVNTALIYYYFESKEGLFRAALQNAVRKSLENYRSLKKRHHDPVDLIGDWFETQRQLWRPIRQLVKIMLDYSSSRTKTGVIDDIIEEFYREEVDILASSVARGIAIGLFRPVDPYRAAHLASTHLDGIMVRSFIQPDFDIAAALDELKSLFWEYLGHQARPVEMELDPRRP